MAELSCADGQLPIGVSSCDKILEYVKSFIYVPSNFVMTLEDALTGSKWQDAVKATKAQRAVWWPLAHMHENASTEAVYDDTVLSTYKVDDGKYIFDFMFKVNMTQHKAMKSYDRASGRVYLVDRNNLIQGFTTDNVNFRGLTAKIFVEKLRTNDGSLTTATRVRVVLLDNQEIDRNGRLIDGGSFYSGIIPLTAAKITVGASASGGDVTGSPSATAGAVKVINANDGTGVVGLVKADFNFVLTNGDSQNSAIDTVTDNGDGTYTIASTSAATGTVDLVAPSALTIDAYESTGAAAYTVA